MISVIAGTMDDTEAPGFRFDPLSGEPLCQQWGSGGPGPSFVMHRGMDDGDTGRRRSRHKRDDGF